MIIKCICGFACERKGDLIYHIDTDLKHREQTGSQLYELILKINDARNVMNDENSVVETSIRNEMNHLLNGSSITEKQAKES